jgi:pre-peptidase
MTLPLFVASAFASPLAHGEELVKPIKYLGPELPPLHLVTPADVPTPTASTGIGPGSPLVIARPDGAFGCTANFIWTSTTTTSTKKGKGKGSPKSTGKSGKGGTITTTTTKTYVGAAGHCFVPEGLVGTHGSDADYDPAQSSVTVCVSNCDFGGLSGQLLTGDYIPLGPVAYARQSRGGELAGQDFGIVEIPNDPDVQKLIRTSMPVWGGPTGVEDVSPGRSLCLYGNGVGVGEVFPTKARGGVGQGLSDDQTYWRAALPSAPGDSGSALITCNAGPDGVDGAGAAGILTHIGLTQDTARVLGTTTGQAVRMALDDAGIKLQLNLADGTKVDPPLSPPPPPPPPPPPTPTPDGTIGVGQQYSWNAGPFTRVATTEQVTGDACDNKQDADDHCDYEFVQVNVPTGGAQLTVTVSTDDSTADFDLYVFGPDGLEVDRSANAFTPPEEISKKVTQPGVYTVAVDPFTALAASYSGTAKLDPLTTPEPPPTLEGDPHIYQLSVIDPFGPTGTYFVAPGELVGLSVRFLHSNDPAVTLGDANGNPTFTATHQILKDGQLAYGPFEATPGTESTGQFQTNNDWEIPPEAAPGTYVFEAFATVGGQTYKTATLEFEIVG